MFPERIGVFIYLYYNREARKLNQYGDFHYHSKRFRYVLLYIDKNRQAEILDALKGLKFVKKVRLSHLDEIDRQFVGNLIEAKQPLTTTDQTA